MARLYQNFLGGRTDALLTASGTSLSSPALAAMDVVASPDEMMVVLDPDGLVGEPDVVRVTAHSAGATTATIVRDVEGATGREHAIGTNWVHGPLASDVGPLAWTAYTPAWTSTGTAPALGNGTLEGSYTRHGKTIHFRLAWTAGSTTTFGTGDYRFSLPATARLTYPEVVAGGCYIEDAGVAGYGVVVMRLMTTTTLGLSAHSIAANGRVVDVGATVPFTFANTDYIRLAGSYEAA